MPAQTRIAATRISSSCALLMILGVASHGKPRGPDRRKKAFPRAPTVVHRVEIPSDQIPDRGAGCILPGYADATLSGGRIL